MIFAAKVERGQRATRSFHHSAVHAPYPAHLALARLGSDADQGLASSLSMSTRAVLTRSSLILHVVYV